MLGGSGFVSECPGWSHHGPRRSANPLQVGSLPQTGQTKCSGSVAVAPVGRIDEIVPMCCPSTVLIPKKKAVALGGSYGLATAESESV